MTYIESIEPEGATGARAEYYEQISQSYTASVGFREADLDDAAYLDVLDTTLIQNALDRLTFALGIPADALALLPGDQAEVG